MKILKENNKGFTLIELLAVIVILGVIMLIAIPSVNDVISTSKAKSFKNNAQLIANAVTTCTLTESTKDTNDAETNCASAAVLKTNGYLSSYNTDYKYAYTFDSSTGKVEKFVACEKTNPTITTETTNTTLLALCITAGEMKNAYTEDEGWK